MDFIEAQNNDCVQMSMQNQSASDNVIEQHDNDESVDDNDGKAEKNEHQMKRLILTCAQNVFFHLV